MSMNLPDYLKGLQDHGIINWGSSWRFPYAVVYVGDKEVPHVDRIDLKTGIVHYHLPPGFRNPVSIQGFPIRVVFTDGWWVHTESGSITHGES